MNKDIIYIDGSCLLCNRLTSFIIKYDKSCKYHICALQSEFAQTQLRKYEEELANLNTLFYQDKNGYITKQSDAILNILFGLGGWWRSFVIFKIIPKPLRDSLYRFIAKNRYVFGKTEDCVLPDQEDLKRIIN